MNKLKILFPAMLIFTILFFSACRKDTPVRQLAGTWNLTGIFVDGAGQSGSGQLRFNGDMTGDINIVYMLNDSLEATTSGGFLYLATNAEVTFNPGETNEFIWRRNQDEKNEQEFEFEEVVDQVSFNVVLEFTR